jgi:hypothetical protein
VDAPFRCGTWWGRAEAPCCNDEGGWGRGFVLALSRRWSEPERRYRAWARGEEDSAPFALGQVQLVPVEESLWVANLIGQHGIRIVSIGGIEALLGAERRWGGARAGAEGREG